MSDKIYEVAPDWKKRAFIDDAKYATMYAASVADPDKFWGEQGKRVDWIKPYHQGEEHLVRARQCLDQMVRGRHAQRLLQLHRPASREARRPDRDHLGRRRSEEFQDTSPTSSCTPRSARFANVLKAQGVKKGDRVTIYLPMIVGSGLRDARLRAHRRGAFGGVRRLLAGFDRRPHRGLHSRP